MKWIIVALVSFFSGLIYAATQDSDGNLVLTPAEVARTSAMFNEMNSIIYRSNQRIVDLEKQVELLKNSKCL